MATTQVPTQLWTAGQHNLGPVSKPANAKEVSIQVAAHPSTDWQTGPAGRVVSLAIQRSTDGGANYSHAGGGSITTPQMGHGGALPTLVVTDVSQDPTGTMYRGVLNLSADVSTGWDLIIT